LDALQDPPLRSPAPPVVAPAVPIAPPADDLTPMLVRLHLAPAGVEIPATEDIAASLAAARRRAEAAEASLKKAQSTAASMVAEASHLYRCSAVAMSR
jgi:hypothetical protein